MHDTINIFDGLGKIAYISFTSEEVGQLLAKHHGKFACALPIGSTTRWPQRSKHLWNMEVFERRDCPGLILQENSTVQLYLCDSFYDCAFTDPSILFWHCTRGFCHCLRDEITVLKCLESGQTYSKSPCIIDVKRVPGNEYCSGCFIICSSGN